MTKRIAFFVLQHADRLIEIGTWFKPLAEGGISVEFLLRPEDVDDVRFLAPEASVHEIDPRFFEGPPVYEWWPGDLAVLYEAQPDELVIVCHDVNEDVERALLLFPGVRTTIWAVPHPDRSLDMGWQTLGEFRAVVSHAGYLAERLGISSAIVPRPIEIDTRTIEDVRARLTAGEVDPNSSFFVVELGLLGEEPILAEQWAHYLARLNQAANGGAFVILCEQGKAADALVEALGKRNIVTLPIIKLELDLRARFGLAALSAGYIGRSGPDVYLFDHVGRRAVALNPGLARHHDPALNNVLWLGCSLAQSLTPADVLRFLPQRAIANHLISFLVTKESSATFVDLLPLSEAMTSYLSGAVEESFAQASRQAYLQDADAFHSKLASRAAEADPEEAIRLP